MAILLFESNQQSHVIVSTVFQNTTPIKSANLCTIQRLCCYCFPRVYCQCGRPGLTNHSHVYLVNTGHQISWLELILIVKTTSNLKKTSTLYTTADVWKSGNFAWMQYILMKYFIVSTQKLYQGFTRLG